MIDLFWKFNSNKGRLIDCAYEYYLEDPVKAELIIACSVYLIPEKDTLENRPTKSSTLCFSRIEIQLPSLQQQMEADMRIIPHLHWTLNFEYDSICYVGKWHCVNTISEILCNIINNGIEKSLHKDKYTLPSCPWTCKHPWRETMLKSIESLHSHWV